MFYHRSEKKFAAGQVLLPAAVTGHVSQWKHLPTYRNDRVYFYEVPFDDSLLHNHMKQHGSHVYRVEPLYDFEPDTEGVWWVDRYMTTEARIVHVVRWG